MGTAPEYPDVRELALVEGGLEIGTVHKCADVRELALIEEESRDAAPERVTR
jgi:hypothetical protein